MVSEVWVHVGRGLFLGRWEFDRYRYVLGLTGLQEGMLPQGGKEEKMYIMM